MQRSNVANERRNGGLMTNWRCVAAVRSPRFAFALALFCCVLLNVSLALSQRRPVLRNARQDLTGSFVLLPANARLHSLALPKQVAAIADHELITPPLSALSDAAELRRWVGNFDFALTDGVILSLEGWLDNQSQTAATTLLKAVRAGQPSLPLYAYVSAQQAGAAFDLVETGLLDFLLVNTGNLADAMQRQSLLNQLAQRRLQDRVVFNESADAAALLLQARLLNRRFGFAPKVGALLSGQLDQVLQQDIGAQLYALGANLLPATSQETQRADLLLFVQTEQTTPAALTAFVKALEKATQDGFRCALLDLSKQPQSRDALLAQLRQRKLLDHLASYAAATSAEQSASRAISRTLAQASAWLVALKFLRDPDVEHMRRTERAQVGLLLSNYLRDWVYPSLIQPKLETFIREQLRQTPETLTELERAETFALDQLKPQAEELFNEQFRRNVHAVLLATGERAEFQVNLLQRLVVRLAPSELTEPDIKLFAYLAHQGNFLPQPAPPRPFWELAGADGLDVRLVNRFEAADWHVFKTDAEEVSVSVKLNPNAQANQANQANQESYSLRSRRAGTMRRIEINAATAQGAFYALGKLEQMGADGLLTQDANLTESPEFVQRGLVERFANATWSHRERLEMLRFLGRVRLNRYVYASQFDPLRRERWREQYPKNELARFAELARVAQENFVSLNYALSPGAALDYASEDDFAALQERFKLLASLGVRDFTLCFDDAPLQLQQEADRAQFKTLAAAQSHLLRRVDDFLKTVCPTCQLSVVPANFIDQASRQAYLQELGANVPARVTFVWLGNETFLPEYVSAQTRELAKLAGRRPLVWDSFTSGGSIDSQLFLGAKRNAAPALSQEAVGFIANPPSQAYAARLPLATVAEYVWGSRGYQPARALESALNLLFDERSRAGVRLWSQAFGGAVEASGPAREHPKLIFDPLFKARQPEINVPLLEQQVESLQNALAAIGSTRERGLLRGELAPILARLRAAIERVKKDAAYERLGNGSYRLRTP
jgi:hypothetical protein